MSFVNGKLVIQCILCNSTATVDSEKADFDWSTNERGMGSERIYNWESDVECPHPGCGNVMKAVYSVSEYPEGVLNNELIDVKGGRVIKKFDFNFQGDDIDEE